MPTTPNAAGKKKILFVSHETQRTGAPLVLYHFLEWLKATNRYEIFILLKARGPLVANFESVGKAFLPPSSNFVQRNFKRALSKVIQLKEELVLPPELQKQKFDLIYLNTIVSVPLASQLKAAFNCPVICHIHENSFTIQCYFPEYADRANLDQISHFIAVSASTKENLVKNHDIAPNKISLINELIPISKIKTPTRSAEAIKQELGVKNQLIVGGSGLTTWRKGIDLFVQLAVAFNKIDPFNDIKLLWIGSISYEFKCQFDYEAERLGIADKIIFTGVKSDPQNYFQLFDVFALTSREDPFPLVALEAAALGKPIICFCQSGGIPELIEDGVTGALIPYGNVDLMAAEIIRLQHQPDQVKKMGEAAAILVEQFDVSVIGEQLVAVIENNWS